MTDASIKLNIVDIFNDKKIDKILNNYSDKTILDFFKDFMKNYDDTCDMFNIISKNIMNEIGMVDFRGEAFYKNLQ